MGMKARTQLSKFYKDKSIDMGPIQGNVKDVSLLLQPDFDVSADQAPDAVFSKAGHRKRESKGVVQIMTMLIEDLNDEIKNGMKSEEVAQRSFEKQLKAAMTLRAQLEDKKAKLIQSIADRTGEKEEEENDKQAAARTAEMDGLVGAKEFLTGYQPPKEALLQ